MDASPRLTDDLKDAISPRTALIVVGVLLLQLAFIWSYVAAFHRPVPSHVPVAVVVPEAAAGQVLHGLNTLPGTPISATRSPSLAAAVQDLVDRNVQAVYIPSTTGTTDHLIVQSATGASGATAVTAVFTKVLDSVHRTLVVTDRTRPGTGDRLSDSAQHSAEGCGADDEGCLTRLLGWTGTIQTVLPKPDTENRMPAATVAVISPSQPQARQT